MKFITRLGIGAIALALTLGFAVSAHAQGVSGTLVGDGGGAYQSWTVTAPASTDVTLTLNHWPCNTGKSVGFSVWGMNGKAASSWAKDACTQTAMFNTGEGGWHEIQLYNYDHGLGVWWTLTSEGLDLGGTTAPAAAAAPVADTAAAPAPAAATDTMTTTAAAAPAAPAAAAPAAAAPAAPAGGLNVTGTVFGNNGGAYADHTLMVTEGTKYNVKMTFGTDAGGTWKGVGFDVWGPSGKITSGWTSSHNVIEASFTATGDVMVLVQPYNFHHGLTTFYTLEVTPAQ